MHKNILNVNNKTLILYLFFIFNNYYYFLKFQFFLNFFNCIVFLETHLSTFHTKNNLVHKHDNIQLFCSYKLHILSSLVYTFFSSSFEFFDHFCSPSSKTRLYGFPQHFPHKHDKFILVLSWYCPSVAFMCSNRS